MTATTRNLWAVELTGPPARPGLRPDRIVWWGLATDTRDATAQALATRPSWEVGKAIDHGPPRPADQVDYLSAEPTPGIVMESLHAQPWPTHGSTMEVVARPQAGGARINYPGRWVTAAEARELIASLQAVIAEVEARGWDQ
jgi:hypothetical protein